MKKNIAVMAGGASAEAGISLNSAKVVCQHLDAQRYNVYKILIQGHDWVEEQSQITVDKDDFSLTIDGVKIKFDAVFVAIHGTPAEDGMLQGYLDMMAIPYNCCGVLTAALTFDKKKTKTFLASYGVRTASSISATIHNDREVLIQQINHGLSYPIFVKPNKNGSSYGASKVKTPGELAYAVDLALQYDTEILIEEFITGVEVTCGVLSYQGSITPLPITEIRSKAEFFDYQAKYEGNSKEVTPAEIDPELTIKIKETSAMIYKVLDFKGMCRIDYIIKDGEYYMLEVNSVPGLAAESILPQQARAMGWSLEELFSNSIEECLKLT